MHTWLAAAADDRIAAAAPLIGVQVLTLHWAGPLLATPLPRPVGQNFERLRLFRSPPLFLTALPRLPHLSPPRLCPSPYVELGCPADA